MGLDGSGKGGCVDSRSGSRSGSRSEVRQLAVGFVLWSRILVLYLICYKYNRVWWG